MAVDDRTVAVDDLTVAVDDLTVAVDVHQRRRSHRGHRSPPDTMSLSKYDGVVCEEKCAVRICGTPECTLPDFHSGACNDVVITAGQKRKVGPPERHEAIDFKLHKPSNKFQLGDEALKSLILNNVGVKVKTHTKFLMGNWTNEEGNLHEFEATILGVECDPNGFMVVARGDDDIVCHLSPEILLNAETHVMWQPPSSEFLANHIREITTDRENKESMRRAGEFAFLYVQTCTPNPDDLILTLDGNGENRLGFEARLKEMGIDEAQWPTIITIEVDPKVALAQRLIFGDVVVYTGSDSAFVGPRFCKGKTLMEDMIAGNNRILKDDMKARVKAVYFDYCGGPPGNANPHKCRQNFATKIFPMIRNIKVFGLTMSRRQHFKLETTFEQYIAVPFNFAAVETFLDNKHVVCKMYAFQEVAFQEVAFQEVAFQEVATPPNNVPPTKAIKARRCSSCLEVGHTKRACLKRHVTDTSSVGLAVPVTEPVTESTDAIVDSDDRSVLTEQVECAYRPTISESTELHLGTGAVVPTQVTEAHPPAQSTDAVVHSDRTALAKLKELLMDGLIPEAIYNAKVSEVLTKMGI